MASPRSPTTTDLVADEKLVPNGALVAEPSIWDTLSEEDRASIERGLAQSLAGVYASDEEVEAAWAAFGP